MCVQLLLGVVHEIVLAMERLKQEADLIYTDFFHVPEITQGTAKGMLSSSRTCVVLKDFTVDVANMVSGAKQTNGFHQEYYILHYTYTDIKTALSQG